MRKENRTTHMRLPPTESSGSLRCLGLQGSHLLCRDSSRPETALRPHVSLCILRESHSGRRAPATHGRLSFVLHMICRELRPVVLLHQPIGLRQS